MKKIEIPMTATRLLSVYFPSAVFKMILTPNRQPNQAHFMVPIQYNKIDIQRYLTALYNVKVVKVNTMIMNIKNDNTRQRSRTKKAIVTLQDNFELPEFKREFRQLNMQSYPLQPYYKNLKHPDRMFMPNKGKTKFLLRHIERIEKQPIQKLMKK